MKLILIHGINETARTGEGLKLTWDTQLFGESDPESVMAFWGDLSIIQQKLGLSFEDKVLCELFKISTGNQLLADCNTYFYNHVVRTEIQQRLAPLLPDDDEPFVLLSHSLGTVIAYEVLLQQSVIRPNLNCAQLLTIGSPLGINAVQAEIRRAQGLLGKLPVPKSIKKWDNFSDILDPVALNHFLNRQFDDSFIIYDEIIHNPAAPTAPHNIDGYLTVESIRHCVATGLASA